MPARRTDGSVITGDSECGAVGVDVRVIGASLLLWFQPTDALGNPLERKGYECTCVAQLPSPYRGAIVVRSGKRHSGRAKAALFTEADMRRWYRLHDLLGCDFERVVDEDSALDDTVSSIRSAIA